MKANELMIGDWVMSDVYQPCFGFKKPIKVNSQYLIDISQGLPAFPIPLTAEILEKNGFERGQNISDEAPFDLDEEGNAYYQVGELGYLNPHMWGWFKDGVLELPNTCTMDIKIRYVHELQHALRICGLNELADDFKI